MKNVQGNIFFSGSHLIFMASLLDFSVSFPSFIIHFLFLFFMQEHIVIEISTLTAVQAIQSYYLLNHGYCIAGFLIGSDNLLSRNWINPSYQIWQWACDELTVFSRRKDEVLQRPFETASRIVRKGVQWFSWSNLAKQQPHLQRYSRIDICDCFCWNYQAS